MYQIQLIFIYNPIYFIFVFSPENSFHSFSIFLAQKTHKHETQRWDLVVSLLGAAVLEGSLLQGFMCSLLFHVHASDVLDLFLSQGFCSFFLPASPPSSGRGLHWYPPSASTTSQLSTTSPWWQHRSRQCSFPACCWASPPAGTETSSRPS